MAVSVFKILAKESGFYVAWAHLGPRFLAGFPNCAGAAMIPGDTSLNQSTAPAQAGQDALGTTWQDGEGRDAGGGAAQAKA